MSSSIFRSGILVAEDDDDQRSITVATLCLNGYHVLEVRDGNELVDTCLDGLADPVGPSLPALILSDVHMPGRTGLQLVADLRARGFTVPVVLMTTADVAFVEARAREVGVAAILVKPFRPTALMRVISRLLPGPQRRRRALLVDRRTSRRIWLHRILRQEGILVDEAHSGWGASEFLAGHGQYDVVILGEMCGAQAHDLVAASRKVGQTVPFLVITPTENDLLRARLERLGKATALTEPLDAESVLRCAGAFWGPGT